MKMYKYFLLAITGLTLILSTSCKDSDSADEIDDGKDKDNGIATVSEFKHPGILFNSEDIERIKTQAYSGSEPWSSGFELLKSKSNKNYQMLGPYSSVERTNGVNSTEANALTNDAQMAYRNAVMWFITGDIGYADKSKEILNAWSATLTELKGGDDMLMAAWYGFNLVNAAEILRYTESGWEDKDIKQAENMFRNVFHELIKNWKRGRAGNWDTAITKTNLAIGVFLNDPEIFNRSVRFYYSLTENSNGTLSKNIYSTGQNFESGRDQTHAQFGIGGLAEACEIGWKQGIDMYGAMDNRLLKGFEYTAKYNLGNNDVPFESNVYGSAISPTGRGSFQPIYEMVYNHYVNRAKLPVSDLKFTKEVVDKVRAESGSESGASQHLGFGSLLFNETGTVAIESIAIEGGDFTLGVSKVKSLKITKTPENATDVVVEWRSENESIAQVDDKGSVTGLAEGETTIVATTKDGKHESSVKVTVKNEAPPAEYSILVSANGFVQGGKSASIIFNGSDSLLVKTDNSSSSSINYNRITYLKLDLSKVEKTPSSVKLRLSTRESTMSGELTVRKCTDNNWSANELTWNNRPTPSDTIATGIAIPEKVFQKIDIDISNYIIPNFGSEKIFTVALSGQKNMFVFNSLSTGEEKAPCILITE